MISSPVTAQALLTLALLAADRALTLNELYGQLQHFLEYARSRSLPTSQLEPLRHHHGVMETLDSLVGTEVVERFEKGTEPVFRIKPGQHTVAAFYRNSAIHWFINRAMLELAMFKAVYSGESDLVKAGKRDLRSRFSLAQARPGDLLRSRGTRRGKREDAPCRRKIVAKLWPKSHTVIK